MQCCPAVSIVTLTVAELSFQHVVFILCYVEGKDDWEGKVTIKLNHTEKCKHGITVGLDEIELTGKAVIKRSLMFDFDRMEVQLYKDPPVRLCTIRLENDMCAIQVNKKYECRCASVSPPIYNVVFRSTIEEVMTETRKDIGLTLSFIMLIVHTKNLTGYITVGGMDNLRGKTLIPEPSVYLTIDNVRGNLHNCSFRYEVRSVHLFKFCTMHLYRPQVSMIPGADGTAKFGNESCATKNLTVEDGETKLEMKYEDQCKRNSSYSCLISGLTEHGVTRKRPTTTEALTNSQDSTAHSQETNASTTSTPLDDGATELPLVRTSQSFLFLAVIFSVISVILLVVTFYFIYSHLHKDNTSDYSYYSSDDSQS